MMDRIQEEHNQTVKSHLSKLETLKQDYVKQKTDNEDMRQILRKIEDNPGKKQVKKVLQENQDLMAHNKELLKKVQQLETEILSNKDDQEKQLNVQAIQKKFLQENQNQMRQQI